MKKPPAGALLLAVASIAVVAAVAGAMAVIGSPADERIRQLDRRRVADLESAERAIDLYLTRHRIVPSSLEALASEEGIDLTLRDPVTDERYEYRVIDGKAYELCARFERDSDRDAEGWGDPFWAHGAGRRCFQLEGKPIRR